MRRLAYNWRVWLPIAVVVALPWLGLKYIDRSVASCYSPQVPFDASRWASVDLNKAGFTVTDRQRMILDLVVHNLPGKSKADIEHLLGRSRTPEESRRYTLLDLQVREKDEQGNWKPFPRTGQGHYWDEFDWDLHYCIGREQRFFDCWPLTNKPKMEVLLIRLNADGIFSSWYIVGSRRWPIVVGKGASASFRASR